METVDRKNEIARLLMRNGIQITGSSAARFKSAMEKKTAEVIASMGVKDIDISIQDNGALDIVLGARVEAAVKRLMGGER